MAITLKMKKEDYEKILAHCQAGFPNESCGLLAGDIDGEVKSITEVYLLTNIDASNEHFSMDPKEQLAAVKDARAKGKKLIGNFHSHPESPPPVQASSTASPWTTLPEHAKPDRKSTRLNSSHTDSSRMPSSA